MRSARFYAPNEPLHLEDVPLPDLGPDEVRVRVRGAGICGTELHFVEGLYPPAKIPMILGHEVAGEVEEVGTAVDGFSPEDRVVVYYYLFCGRCRWCLRGLQHLCLAPRGLFAFVSDGGFAEYVTVPGHCLVRLPDHISFEDGAPLCCSATTALHAAAVADLEPGELAVVYGAGGVGLSLVQVAKLRGARVVAVSRSSEKLAAAKRVGADHAASSKDADDLIRELTKGQGADVVFECVGSAETMPVALGVLGKRGRLVFIGYTAASLDVSPLSLVVGEQQIRSSVGNTFAELEIAVDLAARGQLRPVIGGVLPLEDINEGLERLRRGEVVGRLVVKP
ncbi:MAG: alcohol dehydrogenase catalytic domain-containing protein [Actinomycetota bacterium]